MSDDIEINISYLIKGSKEWKNFHITPAEYFWKDPNDDDLNTMTWDDVPLYDSVRDYLDVKETDVLQTVLSISDKRKNILRRISTSYWNNGENYIAERIDAGSDWEKCEIIIALFNNDKTVEVLRFHRDKNSLVPNYHGFITRHEDGSESEKIIT